MEPSGSSYLFLGVPALPASFLALSLPLRDRSSSSRFGSCGKEVAGIMIPEEIQRLLEGNHKFLLSPLLLNGGNLLRLQGKKLKSFLHPTVLSQRGEGKTVGAAPSLRLMGLGSSGYVCSLCLQPQ